MCGKSTLKSFSIERDEEVEEVHGERERFDNKESGLLDEDISREEVVWALRRLKVKATVRKDGITAGMMNREVLVELWWKLFSLKISVWLGVDMIMD